MRGVPPLLRVLLGVSLAYIILLHAGLVRVPTTPSSINLKYIIFIVVTGTVLVIALFARRGFHGARTAAGAGALGIGVGGVPALAASYARPVAALRLRALDERAVRHLSSILGERAARTGLDYVVATLIGEDGSDAVLVIAGRRDSEVRVESEIITSLAATLGSFRVEPLEDEAVREASRLLKLFKPRKRELPLIVLGASRPGSRVHSPSHGVYLGESIMTPTPVPVTLRYSDLIGHAVILGSTGTGKSTTAATLACRVWEALGVKVVVLDWTGEYLSLLRSCKPTYLDPLSEGVSVWPPGLADSDEDVLEVISTALDLTGPQAYMLQKALSHSRPGSIRDVLESVESLPEDSKWDREVKRGLIRKIGILAERYPGLFKVAEGMPYIDSEGVVVIDSSKIKVTLARKAFVLLLLAADYTRRRMEGGRDRVLYIVDEAHNLVGGEFGFLNRLMAEARKYGMSFAIVTQSPLSIESILINTSTKIVHALRGAREKALVVDMLGLGRSQAEALSRLQPGEAVVYAPSLGEPVFVRVKPIEPAAQGLHDTFI